MSSTREFRSCVGWDTSRCTTSSVFARRAYVAGDASVRAAAFQQRLGGSDRSRALIAVRGGYGSAQLLPLFDSAEMRRTPKAFIGYSDNTSMLAWLTDAMRRGVVSRSHAGGTPGTRRGGVRSSSFERVLTRAEPAGPLTHPQARDACVRGSRWHTGRRYADPTRWHRWGRRSPSIPRMGMCSSSTKLPSVRIASTAC